MREIEQLVEISRYYGSDSRYVVAGGGNTSYKDGKRLWVKASGHSLATITEEGFAVMDRAKLDLISTRRYSDDVPEREEEVKRDLADACITKDRRPSVETSLHNIIKTPFVVHLHPAVVNALMCSRRAEQVTAELFDNSALYVPYADPGYTLFKAVERGMEEHRSLHGADPEVIFLQNHGIFVGGESVAEIKERYRQVLDTLESRLTEPLPGEGRGVCECAKDIIPALRMVLSSDGKLKSLKVENSGLIEKFSGSEDDFLAVVRPFTPDHIVYCKSDYLYLGSADPEDATMAVERFALEHG